MFHVSIIPQKYDVQKGSSGAAAVLCSCKGKSIGTLDPRSHFDIGYSKVRTLALWPYIFKIQVIFDDTCNCSCIKTSFF